MLQRLEVRVVWPALHGMLWNKNTQYPGPSVCNQMQVLFLEQANGAAKRASPVPCCIENCIVLFFGNANVQESAGALLGVEQINILCQSENHVQSLFLGRCRFWFQGDAQRIVGLIKLCSNFPQPDLLCISVGSFRHRVDEGVREGSP